jgi:hypothetical protein
MKTVKFGEIGDLKWRLELELSNGVLTISGTGEMPNCDDPAEIPWDDYRESITAVKIKDGVTTIGNYAFSDCNNLKSIKIPNSVTTIGHRAFERCGLTSITVGNSVERIEDFAFYVCSSLTSITVDSSNTKYASVDGILFNKLQTEIIQYPGGKTGSYTIPNLVTTIGNGAFCGCSNLTSITVDRSNTKYASEDGVLFNRSKTQIIAYPGGKIGSYNIPDSITNIRADAFESCSKLTSVAIPNKVKNICRYAFCGCSGLTSITIPNSVEDIGDGAFYGCSNLDSVTIGNSVKKIRQMAFYECSSLRNVVVLRTTPPTVSGSPFYSVPLSSATLTVPQGSKPAYQSANGWKDFGTIVEMNN